MPSSSIIGVSGRSVCCAGCCLSASPVFINTWRGAWILPGAGTSVTRRCWFTSAPSMRRIAARSQPTTSAVTLHKFDIPLFEQKKCERVLVSMYQVAFPCFIEPLTNPRRLSSGWIRLRCLGS
jgi:hypothetical protein